MIVNSQCFVKKTNKIFQYFAIYEFLFQIKFFNSQNRVEKARSQVNKLSKDSQKLFFNDKSLKNINNKKFMVSQMFHTTAESKQETLVMVKMEDSNIDKEAHEVNEIKSDSAISENSDIVKENDVFDKFPGDNEIDLLLEKIGTMCSKPNLLNFDISV